MEKNDRLYKIRHSAAHVLAQAVLDMFPESKLAFGPPVKDGFYYDFELPRSLTPEDLPILEKKMKKIQAQRQKFHGRTVDIDQALDFYNQMGQVYKVDKINELKQEGETEVTFYENILPQNGDVKFVDLCGGGHTDHTGDIGFYKLAKIAGAYFRGDENNQMLTRIYGYCYETKQELDDHLKMLKEAEKRDHRKLGKELDLYVMSELVGPGLPLFTPRGMVVRDAIQDYLWELHKKNGYSRVLTPHIAKIDLYEKSGHAAKFGDELFKVKGKDTDFVMKPMNCPHHMQIFDSQIRSYKDLPIKYFECPGTVYRDEKSGQLSGLTRVRMISQDDGHLFCALNQIEEEILTIVDIIKTFYTRIGMFSDYWVSLSVRGEDKTKYLGSEEVWNKSEAALESAAKKAELNFERMEDEAAFYGPKLDFMFKDAIGREWQLATIQLDFNLPERFDLSFVNEQGEKERPVVVHRAICGSLERFIAVMIEHTAGAFPAWMAPIQADIICVSEVFKDYANQVMENLKEADVRANMMDYTNSLGKNVRESEKAKVPFKLIIGENEVKDKTVTVREYNTGKQETMNLEKFIKHIQES
ncbi:threonine--tRNA ligase [bacterium]|nr:threonine--tRNA ligase [bacterium]|tara:strand:+ start:819 stop:2573 length:1755 start_codon:yes stop_codon:yes gene_type:complete